MALCMRNVPAVFEWSNLLSTPRSPLYLAGPDPLSVQLSLDFDEEQQTVSLQIRVLLVLVLEEDTADEASGQFLYGLIHPSNVVLLLQDPTHHLPASVSPVLHGPTTTCLRLILSKPVSIVVPSDFTPPLRASLGSQQLLSSLRLLAKQTVLAVHVDQHNISSATAVQRLCQGFTNGSIKQHPRHDNLQGFYRGRGATVLDGRDFASSNANKSVKDESTTMPPPYADDQEAPPPQLFAQAPKKRKWASHTATSDDTKPLSQHKLQMEALLALQQEQNRKILTLMSDMITKRVDAHLGEEMDKMRRENAREWEQVVKPYIIKEVDNSVRRSLDREKEEFKEVVRRECLEEHGVISVMMPIY